MRSIPADLSTLICPGTGPTGRWRRQVARPGDEPQYYLSHLARQTVGCTDSPRRQRLLGFLHAHKLHVFCFCNGKDPAVSHVKLRDGQYFPARNAQSRQHTSDCVFHHRYIPRLSEDAPAVAATPVDIGLNLLDNGLTGLKRFYIQLILKAGRDRWVPGQSFLSAKDWVDAASSFDATQGIPLRSYFKAREAYFDDLISNLSSRGKDWPTHRRPYGLAYVRPLSVDMQTHTIALARHTYKAMRIMKPEDDGAMAGLLVFTADQSVPLAVLLPCAGRKQDMPLASPVERPLCAYLMRTLSYWHENERYKLTLELIRPWREDGLPDIANFIVKNPSGREVPILLLTGDVDDIPRKRAFDQRFGRDGTHFLAQHPNGQRAAEQGLNDILFKKLVAKKRQATE